MLLLSSMSLVKVQIFWLIEKGELHSFVDWGSTSEYCHTGAARRQPQLWWKTKQRFVRRTWLRATPIGWGEANVDASWRAWSTNGRDDACPYPRPCRTAWKDTKTKRARANLAAAHHAFSCSRARHVTAQSFFSWARALPGTGWLGERRDKITGGKQRISIRSTRLI